MKKRRKTLAAGITALLMIGAGLRALTQPALPEASPIEAQGLESAALAPVGPNVLPNPGFEGRTRSVIFPEVTVFEPWDPYYRDQPYTAEKYPVPLAWNPYERYMGRPEYTPANRTPEDCASGYMNRVHSGCNAQQLFGFSRVVDAGVQYTARGLTPGPYEFSGWAEIWVSDSGESCLRRDLNNQCIEHGGLYLSDIATADDRTAMFARLGYDLTCGTHAYASTVVWSNDYGHAQGFYDQYRQMKLSMLVPGDCVTIFIGGYNRFAKPANNLYLDDVSLRRLDAVPTTPAPGVTAVGPTPTAPLVCATAPACVPQVIIVTATPGAAPTVTRTPTPTIVPTATRTPTVAPTPTPNNPTPTQIIPGPTSTGVFEVTPIGGGVCQGYPCFEKTEANFRVLGGGLSIRNAPATNGLWLGSRLAGAIVAVRCIYLYDAAQSQVWASEQSCVVQGKTWSAVKINTTIYMIPAD